MRKIKEMLLFVGLLWLATHDIVAQTKIADETASTPIHSDHEQKPFLNSMRSLVIPGWGVQYATNGEKNGFSRTSKVFALFAGAYLAERVSQRTYNSYLRETDFEKVEMRYNISNMSRQLSLGLIAAGVAVWSYDVIWVYRESKKRKRAHNKVSMSVSPTGNLISLNYAF